MIFNEVQRKLFAAKAMDLGNIGFAAMVIGQLVGKELWRWPLFWTGVVTVLVTYGIAFLLLRKL